jgi:hypothetical protein
MPRIDNKVGHDLPSSDDVKKLIQSLETILATIKTFGIVLDQEERKRLLHARKNADPHVQRVHDLAAKYNVAIPDIPLEGMQDDATLHRTLAPITNLARTIFVMSEDTEGQAESEMWQAFLAYYGVLSSMASRNAELAVELEPVKTWMATTTRRRGPGGGGPGPSPT